MRPVILPLDIRHLDAVAKLEVLCFSMPWSRAMILTEFRNPRAFYLAAEDNGALVGYAGMQTVLDEGYVTNVAVSPASRRRGVASQLLEALLAHANTKALSFLTLEVRASNIPAISLYEKYGFQSMGLRPGYYEKPKEDAVIMTAFL